MTLSRRQTLEIVFTNHRVLALNLMPGKLISLAALLLEGERLSRSQAELLFQINTALERRPVPVHPTEAAAFASAPDLWTDIFRDAITLHVLGDPDSPRALDAQEAHWLLWRMPMPGTFELSDAELAAFVAICAGASSTPAFFKNAVLDALRQRIKAEQMITSKTVDLLNQFIYGRGGFKGAQTSREEAELLLDLNELASRWPEGSSAPEWQDFFIGGMRWHLLHDEVSPGRVDSSEGGWLAEKLRTMQQPLDENISKLLQAVNREARSLPDFLAGEPEEVHERLVTYAN